MKKKNLLTIGISIITASLLQISSPHAQDSSKGQLGIWVRQFTVEAVSTLPVGHGLVASAESGEQLIQLKVQIETADPPPTVSLDAFLLTPSAEYESSTLYPRRDDRTWNRRPTGIAGSGAPRKDVQFLIPQNMTVTPGARLAADAYVIIFKDKGVPWDIEFIKRKVEFYLAFVVPKEARGTLLKLKIGTCEKAFFCPFPGHGVLTIN
jgi:hypothetical protein